MQYQYSKIICQFLMCSNFQCLISVVVRAFTFFSRIREISVGAKIDSSIRYVVDVKSSNDKTTFKILLSLSVF